MLPTIATGNVASAIGGGYEVANSCRWNRADSPYMHQTFSGAGNRDKWTFSCWVKKCSNGVEQRLLTTSDNATYDDNIRFNSDDTFNIICNGATVLKTNRLFRDNSAFYHICVIWDSGNGTSGNRCLLYVNGIRETSFATESYPSSGQDSHINNNTPHYIGVTNATANSHHLHGYLAEVVFQNDSATTPVDKFGEFDSDSPTIFKPIDVSGLTFGTNGFYLDFEDSSNLGNDANGGTDFAEVNIAAVHQATDTPTNNFATLNPLFHGVLQPTFREGNLEVEDTNQDTYESSYSTIQVPTSGKWYWEVKNASGADIDGAVNEGAIGGVYESRIKTVQNPSRISYTTTELSKWISGGTANLDDGEIAGILVDRDAAELKLYVEDSLYHTFTSVTAEPIFPFLLTFGNGGTCKLQINFGNPIHSISSGNQDPNGYGNFEFATKSGYALCSKNLAEQG